MHTKLKGDIGELIAATKLLADGWHVAFPYGENLKYDLLAEKNGKILRIQVKSAFPKRGVLHINCRSSNNWSVLHYRPEDFEVLAAVDLEAKEVYFISSKQIKKTLFNLRLIPTKNKQLRKVNFASNFRKMPL